jgi:uncharacterized protein YejL (UPF0352 family)
MATQQVAPVTCPNCRSSFSTPVETLINGQDSGMKYALLQGRINVAQCPQCGFANMLTVPVLYYDLEKELALVLAPNQLGLVGGAQDKAIGNITNALINSLPAEQRKFYLLNPKQFLTLESMAKAILEADGITEDMLKTQEAKSKLIQEFLQITDKNVLKAKVKERDAELDRDFFEVLTASIQAAQMAGDINGAQVLLGLRTLASRWSSQGKKLVAEIDAEMQTVFLESQDDLLERLQQTQTDEEFEQLVAAGHSMLDYNFFLKLADQADEAEKAKNKQKAAALIALRDKILEVKNQQEAIIQAALKKSAELLKDVVQSGKPDQVLAKRLDEVDETFFMILSANLEEAQKKKRADAVQALVAVGNMAMGMLQQREARQQQKSQQAAPAPKIEIAR